MDFARAFTKILAGTHMARRSVWAPRMWVELGRSRYDPAVDRELFLTYGRGVRAGSCVRWVIEQREALATDWELRPVKAARRTAKSRVST